MSNVNRLIPTSEGCIAVVNVDEHYVLPETSVTFDYDVSAMIVIADSLRVKIPTFLFQNMLDTDGMVYLYGCPKNDVAEAEGDLVCFYLGSIQIRPYDIAKAQGVIEYLRAKVAAA